MAGVVKMEDKDGDGEDDKMKSRYISPVNRSDAPKPTQCCNIGERRTIGTVSESASQKRRLKSSTI